MKALLDTSVIVAALVAAHPSHAMARAYFDGARAGELEIAAAGHALAETYATLTVLPIAPRISPAQAERLITESVRPAAAVIALDEDDYAAAIARVAALSLPSGAVYDALHVRAAEKAGCDELVTFNGADFRRFPPAAPARLVVL